MSTLSYSILFVIVIALTTRPAYSLNKEEPSFRCFSRRQNIDIPSFRSNNKNTVFVKPRGTWLERLLIIASIANLQKQNNLVIIWPQQGDKQVEASYTDLFSAPVLPINDAFPRECAVRSIVTSTQYNSIVQHHWQQSSTGDKDTKILCLEVFHPSALPSSTSNATNWFYQSLVPSPKVMGLVNPFIQYYQWERWGQWIGIDISKTKKIPHANTTTAAYLSFAQKISHLPLDGESVPRFYITSSFSSFDQAIELQKEIWGLNLTGAKGTALVFNSTLSPSSIMDTTTARTNNYALPLLNIGKSEQSNPDLKTVLEEVADFFLLSKTSLIIGHQNSALTQSAVLAGNRFLILM